MALESLRGVERIGGFDVKRIDWKRKEGNENYHIDISDEANAITFYIQNGPIKEVGVNGCQVNTIIEAAKLIVEKLNKNFPCRENTLAITKLDEALMWLRERKRDRETRGVEGYNKA